MKAPSTWKITASQCVAMCAWQCESMLAPAQHYFDGVQVIERTGLDGCTVATRVLVVARDPVGPSLTLQDKVQKDIPLRSRAGNLSPHVSIVSPRACATGAIGYCVT